jgi:Sec-independent protein translocase protein TatA
MLGASLNELGLVALLASLVLLSGKISAIGEALGGLLAGARASDRDEKNPEGHGGS